MVNNIHTYFESIRKEVDKAHKIASEARKRGYDPSFDVEIIRADDTAARVEGLLSVLYPSILNANLKDYIRQFEKEYGKNDLRVSLKIAEVIAKNKVLPLDDVEKRADLAIRAAVAYLTLGVVTAPLEGISQVKLKKNDDGSDYLAIYYAGPIRSAGGTASAMSVLIADFVRDVLGLAPYQPREEEINRYYTEVEDYYTRVAAKQYHPTKEEIELIIKNVPVEITGEPTEKIEVSNYKDLSRVETNKIRGGMCLVLLDGLPLKAEKMLKFVKKYAKDFGIERWFWLEEFIALKKKIHAAVKVEDEEEKPKYIPSTKYLDKLVGGRPVLAFPAEKGGFRLRYGKSFTNGLAGVNLSIGIFYLFDHLAMGTQVALEGPGKAAVVMPHNALENPIVLLNNGDVVEIKGEEDVKKYKNQIKEILYLGDMLVPFGEFVSNNHVLLPAGYAEEWWLLELKAKDENLYKKYKKFWKSFPTYKEAIEISEKYNIPLHPKYNLFWHDITLEDVKQLVKHLYNNLSYTEGELVLAYDSHIKQILEDLGVLHKVREERIILEEYWWLYDLLFRKYKSLDKVLAVLNKHQDVMKALYELTGIKIRKRAPTYLGLRMGRPEKAKLRKMKGSPQMLFPVGEEGGKRRNLMESYQKGKIKAQIITYKCMDCGKKSYYRKCMYCGSLNTKYVMYCNGREIYDKSECKDKLRLYAEEEIDLKWLVDEAYKKLRIEDKFELVKGVRGVSGEKKAVEPIEKGLLRAKYDLYVNKDGTIRFDATDIPLTHFRPRDIGVSVEKLRELGYEEDVYGNPLESDDQILILKPQDIIIPENDDVSAASELFKIGQFLDELLVKVYDMKPYYNFKTKEDVIGSIVVGLAPHTSAGIVGRVIGFGKAKGVLAHPYWHAAKRRNCDGDEDSILLLLDAFLNFSREYLPDTRGAKTMDVPLVLTTVLNPEEVDDESWNFEVVSEYPLAFYEATLQYKTLDELSEEEFPEIAEKRIRKGEPFNVMFTLEQETMFDAPIHSKYVEIPDMAAKVKEQLDISRKIRAADENKVAEEIIKKHLLKDIKGNLRQFSRQKFRCIDCNEKYRRIPLKGKCTKCGGNIVLTVSEGTIRKYVDVIKDIIAEYKISSYTIQNFKILEENIETMFGKKTRQKSLFGFA